MEFESPRFQSDALLHEILNDPDTGTKKLKNGSPAASVVPVQQALLDLHWAGEVGLIPEAQFVDGDYGPATEGTVKAYKTRFGITFPPGVPGGFIDGFTGPRTLQQLDYHCARFDEARAAIEAKAQALIGAGVQVELAADLAAPATFPIHDTPGAYRTAFVENEAGEILFSPAVGAFEVHGPIFMEWIKQGYATGPLGFPTSDVLDAGDGVSISTFQGGTLAIGSVTGRVSRSTYGGAGSPDPGDGRF